MGQDGSKLPEGDTENLLPAVCTLVDSFSSQLMPPWRVAKVVRDYSVFIVIWWQITNLQNLWIATWKGR